MKNLIVWSGGLDSTHNVLCAVKNKENFDTIYFKLGNNELKTKAELQRRNQIFQLLKSEVEQWNDHSDIFTIHIYSKFQFSIWQPIVWLTGLVSFLGGTSETYSKVLFGYIKHDDFWHYKQKFIDLYEALWKMNNLENRSKPELSFPLEWLDKSSVYNYYNESKLTERIRDLTWTCENPFTERKVEQMYFNFFTDGLIHDPVDSNRYVPCNYCDACLKLKKIKKEIQNIKECTIASNDVVQYQAST